MSTSKPVIAVMGATGAQGGGLVRAILADPSGRYAVRAITRDVTSPAAQALAAQGAEVVAADLDDVASLTRAFAGADALFAVTFYWAHQSPETELGHGRNLARAAKAARVPHVIWSTLEDTRRWVALDDDTLPTLAGRYKVPHFDAKGAANLFFWELGVPTTFLHTSFYWDNLIHFGMGPQRAADGALELVLPMGDARLPGIAADDIGPAALALIDRGAATVGKSYGLAGEHLSGAEMAQALGVALSEPVRHAAITPAAYRALGFPGADDLGNMFQWKATYEAEYRAARDVTKARALHPGLQTFAGWLARNARRIPIALAAASLLVATACSQPSDAQPAPAPVAAIPAAPAPTPSVSVERGKELVTIGGCGHCHTPMYFDAKVGMPVPDQSRRLSGHPADAGDPEAAPGKQDQAVIGPTFTSFRAPFGVVYAANLTPDDETGLGRWTAEEFIATMRTGHRKGTGRLVLPPMPWQNLAAMSDVELRSVFAYLRSLPPVKNRVPEPKVSPEALAALDQSFAAADDLEH